MSQKNIQDAILIAFECTSTVQSSDGSFVSMTSTFPKQLPDMQLDLQVVYLDALRTVMSNEQATAQLYLTMLNHGNYYEIQAEIEKQLRDETQTKDEGLAKWRLMAQSIMQLFQSQRYHLARALANYYPNLKDAEEFQKQQKNVIDTILMNVPDGIKSQVKPEMIMGDQVEIKVPMNASEIFLATLEPEQAPLINEMHLSLLDSCTKQLAQRLQVNLRKIERDTMNSDLYTYYLEMQHAGMTAEQKDIYNRIQLSNDEVHIRTICAHNTYYLAGLLPATLTPTLIHALQDVKGRMHLFHNIVYLAGLNVPSKIEGVPNANVQAYIMKNLTARSDGIFSAQMKGSSDLAKLVDENINISNTQVFAKTLASDNPAVHNGPQTLHQTLMQQRFGSHIKLSGESRETLKINCGLALACIKIRIAAVKQTDYECIQQGDINTLYKVIRCSGYIGDPATATRLTEESLLLIESALAYNSEKLAQMGQNIPMEDVQQAKAASELDVSRQLINIPLISDDQGFGKGTLSIDALRSIYLALCTQNRYQKEVMRRSQRRQMAHEAVINALQ